MINFEHNCDEVNRQISRFIDEELSGDLHQFIVHHLKLCVDCRRQFLAEIRVKKYLQKLAGKQTAPVHLKKKIINKLNQFK